MKTTRIILSELIGLLLIRRGKMIYTVDTTIEVEADSPEAAEAMIQDVLEDFYTIITGVKELDAND